MSIDRELEQGKLAPVYVVAGADELTKRELVSKISKAALVNSPKELNETRLLWRETSADDIVGVCRTFPMMGDRRLVVVGGVEQAKAKDLKPLAAYFEDPTPTTTLILHSTKTDQLKLKAMKLAAKVGHVVKCDVPYANRIPSWIQQRAREKRVRIEPDACALLADIVGADLAALDAALERLILYTAQDGQPGQITLKDVEASIARTRVHTVFELTDALGRRKTADALRIMGAMLDAREAPIGILAMIARHIRRLWQANDALRQGDSEAAIGKSLRIHQYFLRDFLGQARMFNNRELAELLERIYQTDRALKSSRAAAEMHMQQLVLDICVR
jgi:DNA polymerase-3 subunit delta